MAFKDYYKILGIKPGSSKGEIKNAWRRMASDTHPDKHADLGDDTSRFLEIKEAYDVLGNTDTKREYDRVYGKMLKPENKEQEPITPHDINMSTSGSFDRMINDMLQRFFRGFPETGRTERRSGSSDHIHYDDLM